MVGQVVDNCRADSTTESVLLSCFFHFVDVALFTQPVQGRIVPHHPAKKLVVQPATDVVSPGRHAIYVERETGRLSL